MGWTAQARRIVSGPASDSPRKRTLPSLTSSAMAPTVSLDGGEPVDAMLVVEVYEIRIQAPEACLAGGVNVIGMAVDIARARVIQRCERRRTWCARTTLSRRPAMARPTSASLVKGPYMSAVSRKFMAEVDRAMDGRGGHGVVGGPVELRHAHAPEAHRRNGGAVFSKLSHFHIVSPF